MHIRRRTECGEGSEEAERYAAVLPRGNRRAQEGTGMSRGS